MWEKKASKTFQMAYVPEEDILKWIKVYYQVSTVEQGDLLDHESLVKPVKCADIIISGVRPHQVGKQMRIIAAIKEAGNRFVPSEFCPDMGRLNTVDPALYAMNANLWRLIEAEGIPHTYISCNLFA
ncbi:hypothetical protein U9M48_020438 [Paspalum notatum var. saurae]|uniref:NmrA-like domain-containing protein n=1 Tax=Paspalum notatum var. saurae TaxID=547442 RepID=A0AAQ3WS08_PASNO